MQSVLSELNCVTEGQLAQIKAPKTSKECKKKIIKINTIKKSKLKIYILNDIINADDSFSYFDHFSKKKKVDPVYSFKIQSNSIIKNIKLQFLLSDFRLELNSFLKNL